jgi:HEAT repeat protein
MTYFCQNCWKEAAPNQSLCIHCGSEQLALSNETFVQKLIRALRHPEPETPIRVAFVLGQLKAVEAITSLIEIASKGTDPYIRAAAIGALGNIEEPRASEFLKSLSPAPLTVVEKDALAKAFGMLPHHSD